MDQDQMEKLAVREPAFRYAAAAIRCLGPSFEPPWSLKVLPYGPSGCRFRIKLEYFKDGGVSPVGTAMDLRVFDDRIEVPTVSLPPHLYHRSLMIRALKEVVMDASVDGVRVFVVDLVSRYKRSLMARGAHEVVGYHDVVLLHGQMDFSPSIAGRSPEVRAGR